ncbi:MAG: hypothetical protein H7301_12350 [Cryobacterium sp.]|nr:hypothetical protein [Oligoflexia bacterium]
MGTHRLSFRGQQLVSHGLHRFFSLPNYLAVAAEIATVPLLGRAYFSALLFTALKSVFL